MANQAFEAINRTTYSTPKAVEIYSKRYLWPYEEFMFAHYLKPDHTVLDLGCGTGRSTIYLAERAAKVVGIDMTEAFIVQGRKLYPNLDLRVMNAAELSFPDRAFDFVFFSNQGIDYTNQREAVLREAYRVLRPGGVFVYSGHNSLSLPRTRRTIADFVKNIWSWCPGYHVRVEHHANGDLHVAFNNIWSERKFIRRAGFDFVEVLANWPNPRGAKWLVGLFERWPMYVCRKPQT